MFCKALQAGCVNPQGHQLHTPPELEKLLNEGWEWQAISEKVEQSFPVTTPHVFEEWCYLRSGEARCHPELVVEV